ncbi:molybdate-binding protein [Pedobacter sp. UYP24]
MNTSSLEITENEYCIKLNKDSFDLTLIRQLIKRIQSEQLFFSKRNQYMDEDLISRASDYESDENFDRLSEK